jgi:oxalyl-CoA decarboxylase
MLNKTNPTERDKAMLTATIEHSANTTAGETPLTDGFHLVIDALKANDIDTIFGLVGIPITDLARLAQAEGMRFIGFRHEQQVMPQQLRVT